MKIIDLLKELEYTNNPILLKNQIEVFLAQAYQMIWELRQMSIKKTLTPNKIDNVEEFFILNTPDLETIFFKDHYLNKYAIKILKYFQAYDSYLGRMRSKGKFNLFISLRENDLKIKGYSDIECAKILRNMESYWIASNQIYTMFEISKIKKIFFNKQSVL